MKRMVRTNRLLIALLALILSAQVLTSSALAGENYVNWGRGYYFTIPDDWRQIERFNVDNFLRAHDKNPAEINYDAFVCPKDVIPFYSEAYMFITSSDVSNSITLADSIQAGLAREFDDMMDLLSQTGAVSRSLSRQPIFNRETRTITQVVELNTQGQLQMLTLVMKFYDRGIANMYFYTTPHEYEKYRDKFTEIADSFSDENLEEAAGKDSAQVVDVSEVNAIETETSAQDPAVADRKSGRTLLYAGGAVILLLAGIVVVRRFMKKA